MKIPLDWLNEYVETNKSIQEVAAAFTTLGLMQDKPTKTYKSADFSTEVLDLEHRMDRSDWLSMIGCAKDIAAYYNIPYKAPELYEEKGKTPSPEQIIDIQVQCPDVVNRFNTRVFRNIKVKASPEWLKNRLEAYGIPSINNIVDITNYVMVETGQPMHAQDLAKMRKQEIVIRKARVGEKIVTLLGEEITLDTDTFVLTQNDVPSVIGGIVGGKETGVSETTTDIVLDAGNYNQNNVRKTSRRLKIQNETVLRYDKYLHPELTNIAIKRATKLILDLAGGEYYENIDWYPQEASIKTMPFTLARLEKISGLTLEVSRIEQILNSLGYEIVDKNTEKGTYQIKIPFYRTDVEVEDDIAGDVLRVADFNSIPITGISTQPPKDITSDLYKFEDKLRDIMVAVGFHEHITDPIVKADLQNTPEQVVLENALSSEKNALRTSIKETLEPVAQTYFKQKLAETKIFEVGKSYSLKTSKAIVQLEHADFIETRQVCAIIAAKDKSAKQVSEDVRRALATLMSNLNINYEIKLIPGHKYKAELIANKAVIGTLDLNSFTLNTEALNSLNKLEKRASYNQEQTHNDDISIVLKPGQLIGEVYYKIRDFAENIENVVVMETHVKESGEESVLLRVVYNGELDLNNLRSQI